MKFDCPLFYLGLEIERHPSDGLICLTDLWQAQCAIAKKRPLAWVRLKETQNLLKQIASERKIEPIYSVENLILEIPGILETTEEQGLLRTRATTTLTAIYAKFLAQECYEWVITNLMDEKELWTIKQALESNHTMTRRALLAAGWSVPVVVTVALNQQAQAQVSPGVRKNNNIEIVRQEFIENFSLSCQSKQIPPGTVEKSFGVTLRCESNGQITKL